jgi:hypothetical protein
MRCELVAIAALAAAGCESVPVDDARVWMPPEPSNTILTPVWAERAPTVQDILKVYPEKALSEAVEGVAYLSCTVKETRALGCVEGTESTPGYGFGPAALQVSRLFVVKEDYPGLAPGTAVRLPVRFKVE